MTNSQQEMAEYTIQDLIVFLMEERQMKIEEAMDTVYVSKTFEKLINEGTGLYLQGSAYVYEILKTELGTA